MHYVGYFIFTKISYAYNLLNSWIKHEALVMMNKILVWGWLVAQTNFKLMKERIKKKGKEKETIIFKKVNTTYYIHSL